MMSGVEGAVRGAVGGAVGGAGRGEKRPAAAAADEGAAAKRVA
jgi:hypothetical protein